MGLRTLVERLENELKAYRILLVEKEVRKIHFAPNAKVHMTMAYRYIVSAETSIARASNFLDHGATKRAAQELRIAKEDKGMVRVHMHQLMDGEEKFRLKVTEEIHLS